MADSLRAQQEALAGLWRQGVSGREILARYATLADEFIVRRFEEARQAKGARGQVAVVALGGYGRRELYPSSDIDLLLLHDWWAGKSMQALSEAVLYPLWDAGFEVGHSVRGIKDAVAFAAEDFHFQVALLDARLLAGSEKLFAELQTVYTKKILEGRRDAFVRTMDEFRLERRQKYGSHSFLLEPHVKEGKGGLRDIQAMLWVAKGVFSLPDLDAIQASGMLAEADRQSLEQSWSMLARVRLGLHQMSRRKGDHLIFEYQTEMASALGYRDDGGLLGVERFMRDMYGHLQTVSLVTDLFFEHVQEILGLTGGAAREQQLERAIVSRAGWVRLASIEELIERPYLLMRLFLQAGRTGLPLHHRTRQTIAAHLNLVDEQFRSSRRVAKIFLELLTETGEIFPVLESMLATGLLTRYLPEFGDVESLAQHDLYHLYTVDRHQMQAVAELAALRRETPELFAELDEPELLYLAALLHDIGKGRQQDHSALGAEMVRDIGLRLRLSPAACDTLAFLVRHHLYLPENALRRDFSDQEFIRQAAELIGDAQRLTMLYLLTIADSRATGPSAWSGWKSSLLAELYLSLKACLVGECHHEEEAVAGETQGVRWLREQLAVQLNGQPARIDLDLLPADYLMSFSLDAVLNHLRIHRDRQARIRQQVLLVAEEGDGAWSLLIMGTDRVGLLAKFCGVLALHNLMVRSAQIFTWPDATVVDVLQVVPAVARDFGELDWKEVERDLNLAINYRLDVGYQLHRRVLNQGYGPARTVQQLERKVVIDNAVSSQFTVIEVYGGDDRVILYQLTQTLADFGLTIHRARIATEVEQLIDVFYVKTTADGKLTEPAEVEQVRMTLMRIVGAAEAEPATAGAPHHP